MPHEGTTEEPAGRPPDRADDGLREANEQLTLATLQAQEWADDSARRYRDLVEGLDAIVWEANAAPWQYTFVSRQAQIILGYPAERWLQEPTLWIEMIHEDDRGQAVSVWQAAAAARQDFRMEYRAYAADGRVTWLTMVARVRTHEDGSAQFRGLLLDSTELKRTEKLQRLVSDLETSEQRLKEKNVELEQFHDIVVGRELKMIRLENENDQLRRELDRLRSEPHEL